MTSEQRDAPEPSSQVPPVDRHLIQTGAPDAAKFVMLGVIFIILLGLLALALRLRHLAKHPKRDVRDLQSLSRPERDD